jgi:SAM-dependent methyltransferase
MLSTSSFYIKHWIRPTAAKCLGYLNTLESFPRDKEMVFLRLEDSLPYRALVTGDFTLYEEYMTTTEQSMHTVEGFKLLLRVWDTSKIGAIQMTMEKGRLSVIDGVHRAAIMLYLTGVHGLPFERVNIEYKPQTLMTIGDALLRTAQPTALANGWSNHRAAGAPYGYHSITLWNVEFAGQRNPVQRLRVMREHYDFRGKRLLDLGCNTGGMMFHLLELAAARGVDADTRSIEAARVIQREMGVFPSYTFEVADLDQPLAAEWLDVDVIFLLAMGSWLRQWRDLYRVALQTGATIFLEVNNDQEGVAQLAWLEELGATVKGIADHSRDDATGNHGRKLYVIHGA